MSPFTRRSCCHFSFFFSVLCSGAPTTPLWRLNDGWLSLFILKERSHSQKKNTVSPTMQPAQASAAAANTAPPRKKKPLKDDTSSDDDSALSSGKLGSDSEVEPSADQSEDEAEEGGNADDDSHMDECAICEDGGGELYIVVPMPIHDVTCFVHVLYEMQMICYIQTPRTHFTLFICT